MGERGKLKLPAHLRPVRTGADAPDTLADKVPPLMPAKPDGLTGELSTLWDSVGGTLDDLGLIAPCDGPVLELALRHFLAARTALVDVEDTPRVYDEHHQRWAKNPASQVARDHSALYLEYAKQLGMTFAARARTPVDRDDDSGADNPFAAPHSPDHGA